jgi:hypothetical protein
MMNTLPFDTKTCNVHYSYCYYVDPKHRDNEHFLLQPFDLAANKEDENPCLTLFMVVSKMKFFLNIFNAGFMRPIGQIKMSLLLEIEWKHNHILYGKIVYKHDLTSRNVHAQRDEARKFK